jgi:Tol biopolymer transport system component
LPETNSSTPEFAARPSGGFDREAVWAHVNRILGSPAFVRSQRRRDLLSWLVRAALEDRGDEITERKVATEVFGRSRDFEPAEDSIVRVEISRLRLNLEAFYATEGRGEPVAISIPKGSYVPAFTWVAGNAKPFAAVPEARPRAVEAPAAVKIAFVPRSEVLPTRRRWLPVSLLALAAAILAAALGVYWTGAPREPQFVRVTDMPGRQVQPSVSPDGSRVAFAWDAEGYGGFQICVKPVHGESVTALTSGSEPARSPAWSPDGRFIAYLQTLPAQSQAVMLIPAGGGTAREVTTVGTNVVGISWTPDSQHLVVPAGGGNGLLALFLVSVATGERQRLTPSNSYFHPAVSSDGRTLAFVTDRQDGKYNAICTLALGPGYLPAGPVRVLRDTISGTSVWPSWSADGQSVLFIKESGGKRALFRVPAGGGPIQTVAEAGAGVFAGREISRGRFLLVRQRELVFLARVPTAEGTITSPPKPTPLFRFPEQDFDGALSPDGRRIAFSSGRGGERGFWIANADGGDAVRVEIPAGIQARKPAWNPAGTQVYFWGAVDETAKRRTQIFRVAVPEHVNPGFRLQPELLALDGADDMNPRPSRDGRTLYFTSNRTGVFRIWRAPIGGGEAEAIGEPDDDWFRPIAEESVDGKNVFYTSTKGIRRFSLQTGARELFLRVDALALHVTAKGIYYDTPNAITAGQVLFQPFASGSTPVKYALGPHRAWTTLPAGGGLLATMVRNESNLELYTGK